MTARAPARRLALNVARVLLGAAALSGLSPACFSGAGGTNPPQKSFYFPVGLAVSSGGNVLYAVNSDFDLQWNGGTLQSYDLFRLRHDVAELINANENVPGATANGIKFIPPAQWQKNCVQSPPLRNADGSRVPLGQACSPPVDSTQYIGQSVTIGAFATDLQLSRNPGQPRLFSPVRGDTTLTWADVAQDDADAIPARDRALASAGARQGSALGDSLFNISCGAGADFRCDTNHQAGQTLTADNTRMATLPGEPFAMAQTEDGTAIAITHQTGGNTSLLLTGLPSTPAPTQPIMDDAGAQAPSDAGPGAQPEASANAQRAQPSMQFVLTGLPLGGDGIAAVPHDLYAPVKPCEWMGDQAPCVRPAFLQTTRSAAELDLLRYFDDFGSTLHRPFLVKEAAYALTANAGGTDSRGIVIDPTPRLACKGHPPDAGEGLEAHLARCAQLPARVFFASRTPPSLVIGEIGEPSASGDGTYDPDRLVILGNIPLSFGPSKVYLAPIVDGTGRYALRVFIVCFDSAQIFVYDPDAAVVENVISVGPGPFAMAFDPFDWGQVFGQSPPALVQDDSRYDPSLHLKRYRFAYVASFTQSFVQVIDLDDSIHLDNSIPSGSTTFETVVFTLGKPTAPKGS
jgi:hypothetical protein